jgi:hypothetical protein
MTLDSPRETTYDPTQRKRFNPSAMEKSDVEVGLKHEIENNPQP